MLECKISAKSSIASTRRGTLACSAQENCALGAKSVHAPVAGLEPRAGLPGEARGTGLDAGAGLAAGVTGGLAVGVTEGLAAGVGLVEGVVVAVGLVEGVVVPGGQRLQVAAQYPPFGAPATNMKGSPHLP